MMKAHQKTILIMRTKLSKIMYKLKSISNINLINGLEKEQFMMTEISCNQKAHRRLLYHIKEVLD